MEGMGFNVNKETIEADGQKILDALDAVVKSNEDGGKFIHSVILTWEEAYLVTPLLTAMKHGKNPAFSIYVEMTAPKPGLEDLGTYRDLMLWIERPSHHVTPSTKDGPATE